VYAEGPILFAIFDGDFTHEQAKEMMAFVDQQFGESPYYALCDIRHQGATAPETRRLLTEWSKNKHLCSAALVGGSVLARTLATLVGSAMRVFSKKPVRLTFVPNVEEGKAWLKLEIERGAQHR
jgi:hypothetical protein